MPPPAVGTELRLLLAGDRRWQQEGPCYCVGVVAVAHPAADRPLLGSFTIMAASAGMIVEQLLSSTLRVEDATV